MSDMSATIVAKSDQINAADLVGISRTITIKEVRIKAGDDQPVTIMIEGDKKAFRPCKGVRRLLVRVWGPDANKYIGQSLTIYCDPTVTWAGKPEGGIRVSHMTGLEEKIIEYMRTSREKTKPYTIEPLAMTKPPAAPQTSDFSGQLAELKSLAKPGNTEALGAKWQEIGPDARKALAAELPALKAACAKQPAEDVPFDAAPASLAEQIAETPAQAAVERFKAQLESAPDAATVETIIAEAEKHRDAFDDQLVMSLEVAFSQARARFAEPVQAQGTLVE